MQTLRNVINLELTNNAPRAKYQRRNWDHKKTIIHWGQRKLLMTEIMFLTKWGDLSNTVVYAGSAPGRHIPYLCKLFPHHKFILVDPNPFGIETNNQITLINGYFDDQIAQQYMGQQILFISDMRTADYRQMTQLENEQFIIKDNETQMRWIQIMQPIKSMIKFRCPYPDIIKEPTVMYQGTIFLQPWAPPTSTETRLVIDNKLNITKYDNLKYEEQLFYHNTVSRFTEYPQPINGEGLDKRFDSSAEVYLLYEFLDKFPQYAAGQSLYKVISEMSYDISRSICETHRTLSTPMSDPDERRCFPKVNHRNFYSAK
jgi:cap2 methyltransferase